MDEEESQSLRLKNSKESFHVNFKIIPIGTK